MGLRGAWHLARLAGIDLYLHWTWFLVLLLEYNDRGHAYSSPVWVVLEVVGLFAIVTLHEFGHALACRKVGGHADRILLWPFGGIAYVDPPVRAGATLWTIAAGPLVNVVLAPILLVVQNAALSGAIAGTVTFNVAIFAHAMYVINLGLLIFNLLPVYPLDGGQILQSLLWFPLGRARSLLAAAVVGFVGVAGLLYASWRLGSLWLAAITLFILVYCWKGLRSGWALWKLSQLPPHDGFTCPWCMAAPPAAKLWHCKACEQTFDIFASGGTCPGCHVTSGRIPCPMCGHPNDYASWSRARSVEVV